MERFSINRWYPLRLQRIGLLLILLVGLALRLYDLGRGSVWVDEALEYWTASASSDQVFKAVSEEILDPPLYSLILHFWLAGGNSEGYLRLPSVVFSMLALLGVMAAGYQLGGAWASLLAGLLMAFSPIDIRYAQEMGQYSLYLCLGIWSANGYLLLQKHLLDPRYYAVWLAACLAAIYTYYGAIMPIAGMYLLEAGRGLVSRNWRRLGWLALSAVLLVAGVLPLVFFILPGQLSWAPITAVNQVVFTSGRQILVEALTVLCHTFSFLFSAWPFTYLPEWLPNLLALLTIGASLLSIKAVSSQTRTWTLWTLITTGLYAILVLLGQYPPGFRHSVFLLTALVPLMAAICTHLSRQPAGRVFSVLLVGVTLAVSLVSLPNISLRNLIYGRENWPWPETNYQVRPIMEHWLSQRQAEDPIYVYYAGNSVFRYYLQALGVEEVKPPYDWARTAASDSPQEPLYVAYGKWLRDRPAGEMAQDVIESLPDPGRPLWIFFMHVYGREEELLMAELLKTYQVDDQAEAKGSRLYHLSPRQ